MYEPLNQDDKAVAVEEKATRLATLLAANQNVQTLFQTLEVQQENRGLEANRSDAERLMAALKAIQADGEIMAECRKQQISAAEATRHLMRQIELKAVEIKGVTADKKREELENFIMDEADKRNKEIQTEIAAIADSRAAAMLGFANDMALAALSVALAIAKMTKDAAGESGTFGALALTEFINSMATLKAAAADFKAGNKEAGFLKLAGAASGMAASFITTIISIGKLDWLTDKLGLSTANDDLITKQIFFNSIFMLGTALALWSMSLVSRKITKLEKDLADAKGDQKKDWKDVDKLQKQLDAAKAQYSDAKLNAGLAVLKAIAVVGLTFAGAAWLATLASSLLGMFSAVGAAKKAPAAFGKTEVPEPGVELERRAAAAA